MLMQRMITHYIWASRNGHVEVLKLLLDHGANVHAISDWTLRWASQNGHVDVVKLLLDHGADVHADNDCAIRWTT
jgi:ankyrin repeat protein